LPMCIARRSGRRLQRYKVAKSREAERPAEFKQAGRQGNINMGAPNAGKQTRAKAKCGGPSTSPSTPLRQAQGRSGSGRDDGYRLSAVGMTASGLGRSILVLLQSRRMDIQCNSAIAAEGISNTDSRPWEEGPFCTVAARPQQHSIRFILRV
jgi:hypothetical protein